MPLMKAIQVSAPGAPFELIEKEIPEPGNNEVLIKVEACGICHGDAVAKEGHFKGIKYPIIPGHEVVGIVEKTGSTVTGWKVGQRVGVGWHGGHCNQCAACRRGEFGACEKSMTVGIHIDGGYAEYMIARPEAMVMIPDELSSTEAAPILCAGRTTFGALKQCEAKGGDLVAIHGFGGLGHLAVQYAVKLGFRTVVISRGKEKDENDRALELPEEERKDIRALLRFQEIRSVAGEALSGFITRQSVLFRVKLLQHLGGRDAPKGQRRLFHLLVRSWSGVLRLEGSGLRRRVRSAV